MYNSVILAYLQSYAIITTAQIHNIFTMLTMLRFNFIPLLFFPFFVVETEVLNTCEYNERTLDCMFAYVIKTGTKHMFRLIAWEEWLLRAFVTLLGLQFQLWLFWNCPLIHLFSFWYWVFLCCPSWYWTCELMILLSQLRSTGTTVCVTYLSACNIPLRSPTRSKRNSIKLKYTLEYPVCMLYVISEKWLSSLRVSLTPLPHGKWEVGMAL